MNSPVAITIDALSLEGFDDVQAGAFAAAFKRELGELIQSRGWPANDTAIDSLEIDAGAIRANEPASSGRALARALHRRLTE